MNIMIVFIALISAVIYGMVLIFIIRGITKHGF